MKNLVDQTQIKLFLAAGKSMSAISRLCNVPILVVSRIKKGKDVSYFYRKPMCTRCGVRPKHKGYRYLCKRCFSNASDGIYPECAVPLELIDH